jgi:copper chaperone CopZ
MTSKKHNQKKQNKEEKITTIPVYGMTCTTCKNKIETGLEKIKGIKKAEASPKKNKVIVYYDNNTNQKEIKEKIEKIGYSTKKENATRKGIIYGLIPHAGCIAFILASIVGASFFMNLFRPLLMSSYFFYALIIISFVFATISAMIYLNKNKLLNMNGIKRQKKYLITLYSTTIIINLALFLVIFPLTANLASARTSTATEDSATLQLSVIIPCAGHAPLIINEVNQVDGVQEVRYNFPARFTVKYDDTITSPEKILQAPIFQEFPATYDENQLTTTSTTTTTQYASQNNQALGCGGGSCGGGASCGGNTCGGGCGGGFVN